VRIEEPGADLAIALAIASAARGVPVRPGLAAFAEIGLTGRLRAATQTERRAGECAKLGLERALVCQGSVKAGTGLELIEVARLGNALALGLEAQREESVPVL